MYKTKKSIEKWLSKMDIKNYSLRDNLVDVEGDVDLYGRNLEVIPVQFGIVKGYFWCSSNNLKSLEGCPKTVGGNFNCFRNNLESLKYLPDIKGELICDDNLKESEEYCKWKYHFIMNQRND